MGRSRGLLRPRERFPPLNKAKQQSSGQTNAVLVDALGTLIELEPPWVHLAPALGVPDDERLRAAVRAEMHYYKAHSHEGRDAASLAELRDRCARLLSDELGQPVTVEQMMGAIRFRPFPDAALALSALRARGLRLICVSNWDCSLGEVLARTGLRELFDGVVSSAEAGARKPDPGIFTVALELAGCEAGEALHVGDTPDEDVAGARAAGVPVLLLDRGGDGDIASLTEIEGRLRP
jgi:FMN phosphatase YigB (HAD superfamily)